jgi:hypothetical protein
MLILDILSLCLLGIVMTVFVCYLLDEVTK